MVILMFSRVKVVTSEPRVSSTRERESMERIVEVPNFFSVVLKWYCISWRTFLVSVDHAEERHLLLEYIYQSQHLKHYNTRLE